MKKLITSLLIFASAVGTSNSLTYANAEFEPNATHVDINPMILEGTAWDVAVCAAKISAVAIPAAAVVKEAAVAVGGVRALARLVVAVVVGAKPLRDFVNMPHILQAITFILGIDGIIDSCSKVVS